MSYPTQLPCVRSPRIPITQIGERHGSGKVTLNKSGGSGTRIWQCPWFMYPQFCDWLLGRVAPNPFGFPQLHRPDTFSPCYPWLYCQEASVEGEDMLGLDLSLRAFYRRAVVTAKYSPMEQGNSIHISSQMLTIPGSQFVFVGANPGAKLNTTQCFTISFTGDPVGGTFKISLASGGGVGGVAAAATLTDPIPYRATPGEVATAMRKSIGLQPATQLDKVSVEGPEGGPWVVRLLSNVGYQIGGQATPPGTTTATPDPDAGTLIQPAPWGLHYYLDGVRSHEFDDTDAVLPSGVRIDQYVRGTNSKMFAFELLGIPVGTFRFEATFEDGTKKQSAIINVGLMRQDYLLKQLEPLVKGLVDRDPSGTAISPATAADRYVSLYVSQPYVIGCEQGDIRFIVASTDTKLPVRFYVGFGNITKPITALNIIDITFPTARPGVKIDNPNPSLVDRLDQNVGKVVPNGEITIQRHQVLAFDIPYFLRVVGCVNQFTFMGFPPWTLLLTGIEGKQTRLPNGTPAYDCTFKFAFNPYTHQALFRPAKMTWEFVRGILQVRLPNNVALPVRPLDRQGQRAQLNENAVLSAWTTPKLGREIPAVLNSRDGRVQPRGLAGNDFLLGGGGDGGPLVAAGRGERMGVPPGAPGSSGERMGTDGGEPRSDNGSSLFGEATWQSQVVELEALLSSMDDPVAIDSDLVDDPSADATYDPMDVWEAQAQALGDLVSKSVTSSSGLANGDTAAAASGVAADIRDAEIYGADWLDALDTGEDTSGNDGGRAGSPGSAYDATRNAIRCGVRPTRRMMEILGMHPDSNPDAVAQKMGAAPRPGTERMGAEKMGAVQPGLTDGVPVGVAGPGQNAVNVGAATSVQSMAIRIHDLGFIYPIADLSPILWMQ